SKPSIVVKSLPSISKANSEQELTAFPSNRTVHVPQTSMSQDLFVPVSPNRSRTKSISNSCGRTAISFCCPLTRNFVGTRPSLILCSPLTLTPHSLPNQIFSDLSFIFRRAPEIGEWVAASSRDRAELFGLCGQF